MNHLLRPPAVLLLVPLVLALGCSKRPKPIPVTGKVTLKGQPVKGAVVTFIPVGTGTRPAVGKTDAGGEFKLQAAPLGSGALPGEYKVTISAFTAVDPPKGNYDPGAEPPAVKKKWIIPEKYADANKSELKATVTSENHEFAFNL